jgi:menaquinone-9 beta-reductase
MSGACDADLVVVGGGPAGASTALHLVRREGIRPDRVVVLDRARFPREKPCAGAISSFGVLALEAVGVGIDVPFVRMRGLRVLTPGHVGETLGPMGVIVRRSELDAHLLGCARDDGVDVRDGEALRALSRVAGGFHVTTTSGTLTTRLIAACDGAGSTTRKLLDLHEPERKGHLYVLETEPGPDDTAPARGLVDFDLSVTDDGLQGYYWDFPTVIDGRPHISRGIYHANLAPSRRVKDSLLRALAKRSVDTAKVKLKPFSTRPFVRSSTTWLDGLVLVGEAAGIDHATGEGIAQAIGMGAIAARHLARALRTGGTSFDGYAREVFGSTLGRHMLQSAWLARRVYGRSGGAFRRYLVRSAFARKSALSWYRGESLPVLTQGRLALGLAASVR